MGFDWDTSDISIMLQAKLAMGTAKIVVNNVHVKGDVSKTIDPFQFTFKILVIYVNIRMNNSFPVLFLAASFITDFRWESSSVLVCVNP